MIALTYEEAQAIRDRIQGQELSDTSFAFLRGMAKLTQAVGVWESVLLPEKCPECDQSPCRCLEIDAWRAA